MKVKDGAAGRKTRKVENLPSLFFSFSVMGYGYSWVCSANESFSETSSRD